MEDQATYAPHIRKEFLPAFRPFLEAGELREVIDTLESDWISTGPKTHAFEEQFKNYVGAQFAVAVSSCTAALHLSLAASGIGPGDEVITSPLTFAATANVVIHQGAKPIFADIDKETNNVAPESVEKNLTERTKAIIPVHYAGHPCEMEEIERIAKEHNLLIIEDAAHALAASYKNRTIGTLGDATCFSFYATKNITTGEGGMLTTNDEQLAETTRMLSLHGINKDAWKRYSSGGSWYYEVLYPGYKYNMTDIQAAIGMHQLKKLPQMQKRREEIAQSYNDAFRNTDQIITPTSRPYVRHAWHLYAIQVNVDMLKADRNTVIDALKAKNIGTSVHFIPVHLHPYYRSQYGYKRGDFPNAEHFFDREISLPLYPRMTDDDVEDVITAVKHVIDDYKS